MESFVSLVRLPGFLLGVVCVLVAERYAGPAEARLVLRIIAGCGLGLGLLTSAALALGVFRGSDEARGARRSDASGGGRALLGGQLLVVLGIGLYYVYAAVLGDTGSPQTAPAKILLGAWLVTLVIGLFAWVGAEVAAWRSGRAVLAEPRRVVRAAIGWGLIGSLFCSLFALNYAANLKDQAFDWSYLQTTSASEATRGMLAALTEPVEVGVFFPRGNEVGESVRLYFESLPGDGPLTIAYHDKDLSPRAAEAFKAAKNGQVIVKAASGTQRIDVGLKIKTARKTLANLDRRFQKALLQATEKRKVAYFTRGHGEATWFRVDNNPSRSLRIMERLLRAMNYSLRQLSAADGLASEVPEDASVVIIVGPQQPFEEVEAETLRRYLARGGRLMVFADFPAVRESGTSPLAQSFDPATDPLFRLLARIGMRYRAERLAVDAGYRRYTNTEFDKMFITTNIFMSHPSVQSLSRHEERIGIITFESGYWELEDGGDDDWRTSETVRTLSQAFADANRNLAFDEGEERRAFALGVAGERTKLPDLQPRRSASKDLDDLLPKGTASQNAADENSADENSADENSADENSADENSADENSADENSADENSADDGGDKAAEPRGPARVFAFADATVVSDALMEALPNQVLVADALRWLTGSISPGALGESEEDVRIVHSREEDILWFHGTVFGMPALVLALGFFGTRRRRRKRRQTGRGRDGHAT